MSLRVSWTPTPAEVARQALKLAGVGPHDVVFDLGCGTGRVLVMATKEFGARKAVGYDTSQERCKLARRKVEKENLQRKVSIVNKDLLEADLTGASVIFLYLSDKGNALLKEKFERECKKDVRIVSHRFRMTHWPIMAKCGEEYTFQTYLYKVQ
ncbi:MAG: SAM-dependent methyltransferase [Nitrososphaerales archaeon]